MKGLMNTLLRQHKPWESMSWTTSTTTTSSSSATTTTTRSLLGLMNIRYKHSSTQIKRLFNQHPARLRLQKKLNVDTSTTTTTTTSFVPQYPATVHTPRFLPNGWCPLPSTTTTTVNIPSYPFHVSRTQNKPMNTIGFLPVYTKHRKDGTKVTTRIKQVSGNMDIFLQELQAVLWQHMMSTTTSGSSSSSMTIKKNMNEIIRVRTGGTIEIDGNYARFIRQWLAGLGF